MLITEKTKYREFYAFEKYLKEHEAEKIKAAAEKALGSMYDLTFGQFYSCVQEDFSHLGSLSDPTVYQIYWIKRFGDFVKTFTDTLKKMQVPQTEDERNASQGLLKVEWSEGILCFCQQWFGLKNYREAEQITMGEILIAKRAQYNRDLFNRNMARIQKIKSNQKRR